MNITFNELREIKHKLPTGSVSKIAQILNIEEQTVRNYFGANKYQDGQITGKHIQPGPNGGIVNLKDTTILETALQILKEQASEVPS
ncbi:MAG: DNA-binding protein [Saprospiraceae bacterium]